jgi:hypothetical protein
MITWKQYSQEHGEQIEFCCDPLKSVYGSLLTWDEKEKKWAIRVDRFTMYQDPYTSKYITKKVNGVQDLKIVDYCMFCGKNFYKEELRYDATGSGWSYIGSGIAGTLLSTRSQIRYTDSGRFSGWRYAVCGGPAVSGYTDIQGITHF